MRSDEIRLDIPVHAAECVGWAGPLALSGLEWTWELVTTGLQLRYVLPHVLFIYITTHTRNKT